MVALSRNLGRKHAMEMLLTGDRIKASEAARMGLVNRIVSKGSALTEAMNIATLIATKSPATIAIGKRAFYEQAEMTLEDAYRYASNVMVENMLARDAEEGIGAFMEKRTPNWTK
jgi:enoyl-CoA hydratase/carnithine racemase